MSNIKVVSIEDGDYYNSDYTSGSTVKVTLARGDETATCDGILIWEAELADNDLFEEWKAMAEAGEEGYTYKEE